VVRAQEYRIVLKSANINIFEAQELNREVRVSAVVKFLCPCWFGTSGGIDSTGMEFVLEELLHRTYMKSRT